MRCKSNGKRDAYTYTLNTDVVSFHLALNKYMNKNCLGFHDTFVEMFAIDVKHQPEAEFLDDEL